MKNLVMYSITRGGHNFVKENLLSWKKMHFKNFESELPCNHEKNLKRYVNNNNENVNVIVVRDLLNWLASYLRARINSKHRRPITYRVDEFMQTWEAITKEAFGETNFVPNKIIVIYEIFKNDKTYRKKICDLIGGKYNELKLNYVPKNGDFSSFDGSKFQNKGQHMATEFRYRKFLGTKIEPLYLNFLKKHKDVVNTYLKYLNVTDDQQKKIISKL